MKLIAAAHTDQVALMPRRPSANPVLAVKTTGHPSFHENLMAEPGAFTLYNSFTEFPHGRKCFRMLSV